MFDLSIEGHMTEKELVQIECWASFVPKNGIIVELGSYKGRSSVAWAKSCDPSVTVYCLDYFNGEYYNDFYTNTKDIKNIIPIKGKAPYNDLPDFKQNSIDIFFLDGHHANPEDIDAINFFLPLIKKGGMLCGHDYFPTTECQDDICRNIRDLEVRLNQQVTTIKYTTLWQFQI